MSVLLLAIYLTFFPQLVYSIECKPRDQSVKYASNMLKGHKTYLDGSKNLKLSGKGRNAACLIRLVMTDNTLGIWLGIPVISIEFLKKSRKLPTFAAYQNSVMTSHWGIIKTKKLPSPGEATHNTTHHTKEHKNLTQVLPILSFMTKLFTIFQEKNLCQSYWSAHNLHCLGEFLSKSNITNISN